MLQITVYQVFYGNAYLFRSMLVGPHSEQLLHGLIFARLKYEFLNFF